MTEQTISKQNAIVAPYAWVILIVVYLASIIAPLNMFKVPPILPILMNDLQIELAGAGWLMSVMAVIGLILALPAGILLQRFGSKRVGLFALGCMAAGSALGALSGSFTALIGSRVVEGIGVGLISVVAPATIASWFPPSRQGAPMGIWATWVPVGSVLTYNLAPRLAGSEGWRAVWWLGAAFALVILVLYAMFVRDPQSDETASRPGRAMPDLRVALANRNIWLLAASFACFNLALVAVATYYPTFLTEVRGYPIGLAGFIASLSSLVVIGSAPLAGWVSDRLGSRRLVFSIPFLVIAGMMLLPFKVTGWQIIAVMVVQGLIVGAIPTATFAAAPEVMRKPELAGLGLAVVLIGQNLGNLIGPVLFGETAGRFGWAAAGYLMIPVCLFGFISAWKVRVR